MTALASIPTAPQGLPVLGHLGPLLRDPLAFLTSLHGHGDLVRVRLGPRTAVVVCAPEPVNQLLRDDRTFDRGGPYFDRLAELLGDSLAVCPHHRHRRQRRLVQPAFRSSRFPGYAKIMTARITETTDSWHDGQVLDIFAEMMSLTARITVATMFSDSLPPPSMRHALDDLAHVFRGVGRRIFTPSALARLPTPGNRRYQQAVTRLRGTLGDVIAERRAGAVDHGDLVSALLADHDADEHQGLTDTELIDQALAFFGAGTETTATTLAWALYLIDQHPDVARRLHAEVTSVLDGAPAAGLEHVDRLEFTSRVIKETLRLYPPGWMFTRTATADTHLGGHSIPAGTTLLYSPYLLHHRPDLHADPERFDPDRWDDRRPQPRREAFIPFGAGARKCIGDRFGLTVTTLALATIVVHWRLHTQSGRQVRPAPGAVLTPKGLRMRAVARPQRPGTESQHRANGEPSPGVRTADSSGAHSPTAPRGVSPTAPAQADSSAEDRSHP
ncbi:cytochrome P450 [Streptomyces tendae]|uniref:cytochrome P450 n=1 Tax=Streptomyces tendae TaxID=1932 RepID=UPI0036A741D2